METGKQLPIRVQKHIINYLYNGYFLSVILADERATPWFYENYVQLCFNSKKPSRYGNELWLDFYGGFTKPKEWLDIRQIDKMDFRNVDIIDYLKLQITNNHYVFTFFDEALIKNYPEPFVHDIFVYGFDDRSREFSVLGFGAREQFESYKIDYDKFKTAFQQGFEAALADPSQLHHGFLITSYNRLPERSEFKISGFLANLSDFIYSRNSYRKEHPEYQEPVNELQKAKDLDLLYKLKDNVFGFNIYQEILFYLENFPADEDFLDYRIFHTLYEHKTAIHQRIAYLAANHRPDDDLLLKLNQAYYKIVTAFNATRLLALRYTVTKERGLIEQVRSSIARRINEEQDILHKMYNRIASITI